MTRTISSAVVTASRQLVASWCLACRLDFAGGVVRATNAPFTIAFAPDGGSPAEDFLGVGNFGGITLAEEGTELRPYSVALSLSAIPVELVSLALTEDYQGRDARVWLCFLDPVTNALAGQPLLAFRGRMDTMDVELGETATIALTVQSRLADWDRPRVRRYTNEDQQALYPGDKGFEFVPQMAQKEIIWGKG